MLSSLVSEAAHRFGSATALTIPGDRAFTFSEIDESAGRFAAGMLSLGIRPGDRVVLHLPNGWEWIVAYHGLAKMGAVVVPANILLTTEEVAFILADAGARAIILPSERRAALRGRTDAVAVVVGRSDDAVSFLKLLVFDPAAPVARAPEDLFTIGYTSGTTGRPKGAMLSHGCVYASLASTATYHVRHAGETVLSALPFSHVYGNIVMNSAFLAGMRLVAPARFDPADTLALIKSEAVTLFEGVPTMYYQMLAHPDVAAADLSSLTRCTVGGQTMPTAKIEAVVERFGCPLLELWGMTELAGPAVTHSPYWKARPGSVGLPFPDVEVRIDRAGAGSLELGPDEAGELMVRGPLVMQGYWNNPEATKAAIDSDGWLATGDVARRDANGYLYVVDRKKDLIITGGYNVYPAELEQAIALHPSVAMVAVTGVADEEKGEIPHAFIVRHADSGLTETDILAHCRTCLAPYKIPRLVSFVPDLPKTSTGKILRHALRRDPAAA